MNKKDNKGIDEELLKSFEVPDKMEFRVVEVLFNPIRIQSGAFGNMDYYLYLIEAVDDPFRVHLVEEVDLHFSNKRNVEVKHVST